MSKYIPFFIAFLLLISCKDNFKELTVEKNTFHLTTEQLLENKDHVLDIEQFYEKGKEGYFSGKDSISIYYKIFKQTNTEKGAILISSGRTEAAIKYQELIFDLFNQGYSIYILDHRGQGLSGRMVDDPDMGYIDDFQFYIDDMKHFYSNYLFPNKPKKTYLLAHSMGGAIGMTYLEQYPNDFNAAAFSSPMLGLKRFICTSVKILAGEEPKYALGETKYKEDSTSFKNNTLTSSKIRYYRMIKAFDKNPKAKLGGASYTWVDKSCKQFEYLFDNIEKIQTPFILFSAENDKIIEIAAHQEFVEKAKELNKNCEGYLVKNAKHELLIEKDEYRMESINKTLLFFGDY